GAGAIPAKVTILVFVAVSNGALVFHAKMGRFHQFVAIRVERIRSKPMFKCAKCWFNIGVEMRLSLGLVFTEYTIIEVQHADFTVKCIGKMDVVTDVYGYVIVIDGIADKPIETRIAVSQVFATPEPSVGYIGEARWHTDADQHAV